MSDSYDARNSIYCYEGTDVLINNLDIHDNSRLKDAERKIVAAKLLLLRQADKTLGKFDKEHFTSIHKFLFEDIYPFAGKFRTENIAKDSFTFADFKFIDQELDRILDELKDKNYFSLQSKEELALSLANLISDLNVLHPFREGNGRTIREFIRELALKNGYVLDLRNADAKDILDASIESIVDANDLAKILENCLSSLS